MSEVILIRHGQSLWNKENKFTGWVNVDLSEQGIKEATEAGEILKRHQYKFDLIFTSKLLRAQRTADIVKKELGQNEQASIENWRLNERHYGALQGLNKKETALKHGDEQVKIWRRSYSTRPPLLDEEQAKEFEPNCRGESLEDTVKRVIPYWEESILPELKNGKKILIAAHGNSLRALMKYLYSINDDEILKLEIPTGKPLRCSLNEKFMGQKHEYLD